CVMSLWEGSCEDSSRQAFRGEAKAFYDRSRLGTIPEPGTDAVWLNSFALRVRHRPNCAADPASVRLRAHSVQYKMTKTVFGEVTERPKVRHWKCRVRVKLHRGFESRPLRISPTGLRYRLPVFILRREV